MNTLPVVRFFSILISMTFLSFDILPEHHTLYNNCRVNKKYCNKISPVNIPVLFRTFSSYIQFFFSITLFHRGMFPHLDLSIIISPFYELHCLLSFPNVSYDILFVTIVPDIFKDLFHRWCKLLFIPHRYANQAIPLRKDL